MFRSEFRKGGRATRADRFNLTLDAETSVQARELARLMSKTNPDISMSAVIAVVIRKELAARKAKLSAR